MALITNLDLFKAQKCVFLHFWQFLVPLGGIGGRVLGVKVGLSEIFSIFF